MATTWSLPRPITSSAGSAAAQAAAIALMAMHQKILPATPERAEQDWLEFFIVQSL